jgi:copper transport protein
MARTACTRTINRLAALAVATLLALLVVGAGAPAWGHARVTGSDPADGTRLEEPPRTMTFTFNEDVNATLGGIRIFDRDGNRVDRGAGTQPVPSQLTTAVAPDLDPGTYLSTYRVVSADGHVITGAVTFAVGTDVNAAEVAGIDEVPSYLRTATIAGNVILYGGALMAIGLAVLLLVVVGERTQQQQLVRWLRAGVVVAVVGAAIRVVTIAIEATGRGPTVIFDDGVLAAVLRQGGTGWWLVGMFIGLAALVAGTSLRAGVARQMLIAYGALVAAGSFALTGHTSTGEPLVLLLAMTTLHMLVAAVWLGGLVGVAVLVATSHPPTPNSTTTQPTTTLSVATVVSRFSTLALVAVATLWISGAVQAWWTVGDPTNLFSSTYGRLLMVKLGLVVITMALAAWNRWRLVPAVKAQASGDQASTDQASGDQAPGDQAPGDAHRTLARTVRWELVVLALVVVVTSVLVDTPPARYDTPGAQPFSETVSVADDLELQLLITPGAVGRNELHVTYIDAMGLLDDRVESVILEMSLPDVDIGPITTNAVQLDPGHYLLTTDRLTVAGTWTIEVVTRIGAFDQQRSTFTVPIGT